MTIIEKEQTKSIVERSLRIIRSKLHGSRTHQPTTQEMVKARKNIINYHTNKDNDQVWMYLIAERGFLTDAERMAIVRSYRVYKSQYPLDHPPVRSLLRIANIRGDFKDEFYDRVAFNYEYGLASEERLREATLSGQTELDTESQRFWSFERWVQDDFEHLLDARIVATQKDNEIVYNPNRWDGLCNWSDYHRVVHGIYLHEVYPYLRNDEVITAGRSRTPRLQKDVPSIKGQIVRRFGDLPSKLGTFKTGDGP